MSELTEAADLALRMAALEAQRGLSDAINGDHLLIGLLSLSKLVEPAAGLTPKQRDAVRVEHDDVAAALGRASLDPVAVRRAIRASLPPVQQNRQREPLRDPACLATFARAEALAHARGSEACGVLDLLSALLECPSPALLMAIGAPGRLRQTIAAGAVPASRSSSTLAPASTDLPSSTTASISPPSPSHKLPPAPRTLPGPVTEPGSAVPPFSGVDRAHPPDVLPSIAPPPAPGMPSVPSILLRYGRDLTADAEAGKLRPVVGRHDEMLQVVRVLRRRTKNAPVLIGEAGVGKTAVVEGLARLIAEGTALPGRRIVALSLASVVAGTSYRGQFEERLEQILAALRAHPEVILFLDEIHTVVGAGDADGRLDAASILKPALSRGEIACIGATTVDEYHRYIEADPALERRFQPILVAEPSAADALAMLEGVRPELERHHGLRIDDGALAAAVDLTVQHVPTRRLPDKALDALDEACAWVSVPSLGNARESATESPDTGTAPRGSRETDVAIVTRETVVAVVSGWLGAPLGTPAPADPAHLADLASRLAERIVGQSEAIRQVTDRVRLARAGLTDPERPAAVLLFVGPPGVGKTELALALAGLASDGSPDRTDLIRLAMSDYAEPSRIAHLFGVSPVASGRATEGQLTGPLRRRPRAVVLLDDAERAHPDALGAVRPLLTSGRLTDGQGRLVDARQAIIVLTARLPGDRVGRRALGFSPSGAPDVVAELRSTLGTDLLSLVDEIVHFRPLGRPELREIVRRQVDTLRQRLCQHHGIELTLSEAALSLLADRAVAESNGGHAVERVVSRLLAEPLGQELLAGPILRGAHLRAEPHGDVLRFSPSPSAGR